MINHHQYSSKFWLINKQLTVRKALFVFNCFVRSNGWSGRSGWQRCFKTLKLSFLQCLCEVECAISHWLAFPATNNKLLVEGRGTFLILPVIQSSFDSWCVPLTIRTDLKTHQGSRLMWMEAFDDSPMARPIQGPRSQGLAIFIPNKGSFPMSSVPISTALAVYNIRKWFKFWRN